MPSKVLLGRLEALRRALIAGHAGGTDVSSHSMGKDRELFINLVLSNIISVPFRTGTSEIVDANDTMSAQCDIVIEYMNTLSFPNIFPSSARLYLAERVCAVIEVKSTISEQWKEVIGSAAKLRNLVRKPGVVAGFEPPPPQIPLFAVGYKGWANSKTAHENMAATNNDGQTISGILQIDPCFFVGAGKFEDLSCNGAPGLYGFLLSIESLTSIVIASKPLFSRYMK